MSSESRRALLSIDDLTDAEVDEILAGARARLPAGKAKTGSRRFSLGLLFWEDSLRTRAGYSEAALRMGGASVTILGARNSASMSAAESFEDTLRTFSGMVDLMVARVPFALERTTVQRNLAAPLISGGDGGPAAEHPSQAIIDLFAAAPDGDISRLRIGICGDLQSRAARSTMKLLARRNPRELRLICPPTRAPDRSLGLGAQAKIELGGLDVLVMAGLPARRGEDTLDETQRAAFSLTGKALDGLERECVILCPMPAIDEVGADAREDPRLQMFRQSDHGVAVRAALLEHLLSSD